MNQIYSALEHDPLRRFQEETKKISEKAAALKAAKSNSNTKAEDTSSSLTEGQKRIALQQEYTYQALLAARALFEKNIEPQIKEQMLLKHIQETRFLDTNVLLDWQPELLSIFRRYDTKAFDELLDRARDLYLPNTKAEVIKENWAALSSQQPAEILDKIITSLKEGHTPKISLEPQRVLELLK